MKIIGTEKCRQLDCTFSVHVVDILDSIFTVNVKNGFFRNSDLYKKNVFTNGRVEKKSAHRTDSYCEINFKVIDGDWVIIIDNHNNLAIYINEQYCGPIKVKNRKIQARIDESYLYCRNRIDSKREFAKQMGSISMQLNLPFQIVLAFKGNKELLNQMVENIENAITNRLYEDNYFMSALSGNNHEEKIKAIESVGIIRIPNFQADKIAKYLYDCLENRKIIRRFE